eukprot:m.57573 g.57573  ORF g.57573 m.57573 type:complete len:296 (-) comp9361_c0_seq1:249-1136(-)
MPSEEANVPFELRLLAYTPPENAGRLGVVLSFFFANLLLWLALQNRPTPSKGGVEGEASQTTLEKSVFATRFVSQIHAIVVTYGSSRYLYDFHFGAGPWDGTGTRPIENQIFEFYIGFSVAFFIGDFILCTVLYDMYGKTFLFHAVVALFGFMWGLLNRQPNDEQLFWIAGPMHWETSTIFLNNMFLFRDLCPSWRWLQAINGFTLVVVFGIVRLVIGWHSCYTIILQVLKSHASGRVSGFIAGLIVMAVGLMAVVNLMWFVALGFGFVKNMRKHFGGKSDGKVGSENQSSKKVQ